MRRPGKIQATLRAVEANRELAAWIISQRREIETLMNDRLGPATPKASSPEAEALRRFRTFVSTAIQRGVVDPPALDGLRVNQRRTEALLETWVGAAAELANARIDPLSAPYGDALGKLLPELATQFRVHLRGTQSGRKTRGTPRSKRRVVIAAIDRIREAFLAIDADTGTIEDANPAAGALLGLQRDALLGVDAMSFVPDGARGSWWQELDAIGEGADGRVFTAQMTDTQGAPLEMDASVTRFATRGRTLALVLMRPPSQLAAGAYAHVAQAAGKPPQPLI
jgi:PAS domain-containing protein